MAIRRIGIVPVQAQFFDRKVLVALAAKKLWNLTEELALEHEQEIKLMLNMTREEFRDYLLDVAEEAIRLIKERRGPGK